MVKRVCEVGTRKASSRKSKAQTRTSSQCDTREEYGGRWQGGGSVRSAYHVGRKSAPRLQGRVNITTSQHHNITTSRLGNNKDDCTVSLTGLGEQREHGV